MIKMSLMIPCKGASARLRKDGIVEVRMNDYHTHTLEEVKDISRAIRVLGQGKPVPVLRIAGKESLVADGVREFASGKTAQQNITADAIVVRSLSQWILGNLYLRINRPQKPTRVFGSIAEAEQWLSTFVIFLN